MPAYNMRFGTMAVFEPRIVTAIDWISPYDKISSKRVAATAPSRRALDSMLDSAKQNRYYS
jgi:hypothetical protein